MLIEEGKNFTVETNKELKEIINKYLETEISDLDLSINLKKYSCYCKTEFFGEYDGYRYTIHAITFGKWFETEYYWVDENWNYIDGNFENLLKSIEDYEISELDDKLNFGKVETDISSIKGGEIEWSEETPTDVREKCEKEFGDDNYDELISLDEFEMDEYHFNEPNNNISSIEISFKDSQNNEIKIDWSNKNIT